jgi:16S rRNA (guanine527-N7)-methyltransferase
MSEEEFLNSMENKLKEINIKLTIEKKKKFYKYMNLLLEWNKIINLTAIEEPEEIIIKHFIDSITPIKWIKSGSYIADIGTGAGFPGIPIAIIMDKSEILLIDSLNKRVNFLNEVIKKLELKNVNAIHCRAEEAGNSIEYREKFDVTISRAVANMSTLLEYLIPLTKINGTAICMKGNNVEEELEKSKKAFEILKAKIEKIDNFYLPQSDYERNLIIVRKLEKTQNIYPRMQGKPAKDPIM